MKKLMLIVLVLVTGLMPLFAGGGREAADPDQITIAVVPKGLDNPVFLDTKSGAEAAGAELGVRIIWTGPVRADATEQVAVLEGLIQQGVDGILVSANDPTALNSVIQSATDAGIKVATFDSDAPESARIFYAGSDNYVLGQTSAELLVELAAGMLAPVETAVLTGVLGAFNLEERIRGVRDTVEGTNVRIASVQAGEDDIDRSVQVIEDYTEANPGLDAWIFVGGWPFFAPPETLAALRRFRDRGGLVVSVDSFYPMLEFVEADMADYLVGQNFYAMGDLGVRQLLRAIQGGRITEEILDTGLEIVSPDNVAEIKATKDPW